MGKYHGISVEDVVSTMGMTADNKTGQDYGSLIDTLIIRCKVSRNDAIRAVINAIKGKAVIVDGDNIRLAIYGGKNE